MFGLKAKLFGGEPRAYRQEIGGTQGGYSSGRSMGLASGLTDGTLVATALGWRPANAIAVGDLVLTFDRGLQPIKAITRGVQWDSNTDCPEMLWPLKIPAGAIGNKMDMTLLPEQCVMVESDMADMLFADPFSLIAAADLEGFRGIHKLRPTQQIDVIQLHFDDDEVIFADTGVLVFCPSLRVINVAELLASRPDTMPHVPLTSQQVDLLLDCLTDEDEIGTTVMPKAASPAIYAACA